MNKHLKQFVSDKEGNVVLFQSPNVPIIVWVLASLAARFTHGTTRSRFELLAFVAIIVWALLELGWGSSYFRRVLGFVVLAFSVASRLR